MVPGNAGFKAELECMLSPAKSAAAEAAQGELILDLRGEKAERRSGTLSCTCVLKRSDTSGWQDTASSCHFRIAAAPCCFQPKSSPYHST